MKRVACYVRVSTEEQKKHGLSVDSQISALEQFCKEKGYIIQGIYNDAGISARKSYRKRPALLNLIDNCKEHKIDLIIFTKLDRWFRSVGDYYEVQSQLEKYNVPWRAIWEDYETETSSGMFKVNIMLSVAQSEADRTSERIKAVMDYKRQNGDYIGALPYGFIRKDNKLYHNEDEAPIVRAIFDYYLKTYSGYGAFRKGLEIGYPYSERSCRRMIKNPIYLTAAEPYITKDEYNKIQESFNKRTRINQKTHNKYIFSGLLRCKVCGCRLAGSPRYDKGKTYLFYSCNGDVATNIHSFLSVSEKMLENYLLNELENIIGNYNMSTNLQKGKNDELEYKKKKKALEDKKERIGIRFEIGEISVEEYKQKIFQIQKELVELHPVKSSEPIQLDKDWKEIYQRLDSTHKLQFWKGFIDYIVISKRWESAPEVHFLN